MIKTYLVPTTEELIDAMKEGEAPSFLHVATCLTDLTNGEVLMKIYGLSEEDVDFGTMNVYVYKKGIKNPIMTINLDWWNQKWGE